MPELPPPTALEQLIGDQNLLVLAPAPGDESIACGGLIARCCRRGRPPFVMVLGDGTTLRPAVGGASLDDVANQHERETRAAVRRLGLPDARLLMAGVYDDNIPADGRAFDAVVQAVTLVMWGRDCNVICAPCHRAHPAAANIARAVAAGSGVGLLTWIADDAAPRLRLDIGGVMDAKRAAVAAHASRADGAHATSAIELFRWEG